MGGVAFLAVALIASLAFAPVGPAGWALAALVLAAGAVGLLDDVMALRRKRLAHAGMDATTGLLARYRIALQAFVGLAYGAWAAGAGYTMFAVPLLDILGFAFVVVGTINAFNFTDGLDGLAGGISGIVLLAFWSTPLAPALIGALLGFLWYNAHPARVFMGGIGAEALGAAVAGLAIVHGLVWWLPLLALVPAQVLWFRATGGRRLFRMSPLHNHFELSGWTETRIVTRFWLVTALTTALALGLMGRS
jgi:phospho-N-acetylmuramoyl-pentapeptide-transferase